ncbi:MAG: hypothetical protein PVF05_08865 [Gemmatimonadales bacterium]|jgi:hypothetical protein
MRDADRRSDFIGMDEAQLEARLGPPDARRATGGDLWLVFETPAGRLRVRCRPAGGAPPRVASWTLGLAVPAATLREALEPLGLWPAAGPDAAAAAVAEPLVRRALPAAEAAAEAHSLTATIRGGRFTHVSVFDEPPDWL